MGHNTIAGKFNVNIAEVQAVSINFKNIQINPNFVYVFTDAFIDDIDYNNLMNLLNSKEIKPATIEQLKLEIDTATDLTTLKTAIKKIIK